MADDFEYDKIFWSFLNTWNEEITDSAEGIILKCPIFVLP